MMNVVLRTLVGTLLGVVATFALLIVVEGFSAVVHPMPKEFTGTMEEMCRHVENYPQWVLAAVVPMWAATALVGTWIARRFGNLYAAGAVGLLILVGLVFNVSKLPYPMWFKVVCLLAVPAAVVAGYAFRTPRKNVLPA